ncbi:MAG: DNA recombination protein RmuC [Chlamydiae bacterium CG10_big_fil_rev_8_21_14_0_10_35_9]|nr:MAG: DNA recombination protein RmuC [Chlamydiae bacterium CG10_big_fil_rev_8_21_14_0_10_35_9]
MSQILMTLKIELLLLILAFSILCFVFFKYFQKQFQSISLEIFQKNQDNFLNLSEKYYQRAQEDLTHRHSSIQSLVAPLKEVMDKVEKQTHEIERKRESAYTSLQEQIRHLADMEKNLRKETMELSRALKSPNIRGSWGQLHLKRVVELAGLLNRCDFFEQPNIVSQSKQFRPDLVVHLPSDKNIVIDAKTPTEAYFEAMATEDLAVKEQKLKDHAVAVKRHIKELSAKEYWMQFKKTPEYVILFLPAESFLSAAVQSDPTLIESGVRDNIILASPTTLISILRAIAHIWKQDAITKNTLEIGALGKELYERLYTLSDHWNRLGKSLNQSVEAFNQANSSMESRVMVSAKKLKELGVATSKEISLKEDLDSVARTIHWEEKN